MVVITGPKVKNSLVVDLLTLTERPYEEYNAVLTEIMTRLPLDVQVETFQRVLGEELPFQTVRRAYRIAIRVAMGEKVDREQPRLLKKHRPKIMKESNGKT